MNIGHQIRASRQRKKLSQEQLAELIGVSQDAISSYETGRRMLDIEKAKELAKALDISLFELIGESAAIPGWKNIPVIGEVPAGIPMEEAQNVVDTVSIPGKDYIDGRTFALRVIGESMSPRIIPGDIVIVRTEVDPRNNDVVVVRFDLEKGVTIKRFRRQDGVVVLVPENPAFAPIVLIPNSETRILGKVIKLVRDL